MMRILYVANFDTDASTAERTEEYIFSALSQYVNVEKLELVNLLEDELVRTSPRYDWMLFSTTAAYMLDPEFLARLKCKSVIWTYDWMWMEERWFHFIPFAQKCTLAITTDDMVDWGFYGLNHRCLRQGVDEKAHYPGKPDPGFASNVAFTGSVYTWRRKHIICDLKKAFGDKFRVWQTGKWRNNQTPERARKVFRTICASAKVLVGDKLFDDVKEYWSYRVYQTLGCGGFLIQEYVPGMEKEFANGEHLVLVPDSRHLVDTCRYYLDKPAERGDIAKRGYRWVHEEHSYKKRAEKLIKFIEEHE